ncbi:MAG: elongation factor Ts, partial [Muribaculaceae bacterium]|nr:elongation factor Ts [Muribaculaceae bacterium]
DYVYVEAPTVSAYEHLGNKLATIVGLSVENIEDVVGKEIAMQVAAMNPIAVDRDSVPAEVIAKEREVAIEKTKEEQVKKAVEAAIKKAGINPNLVDSEDHIASNIAKGWLTEEEAEKARVIAAETAAAKAANLPAAMIENIANGRINKFLKETVLMEQEYHRDAKLTVAQYLESVQKGLVVVDFKRVNLNED